VFVLLAASSGLAEPQYKESFPTYSSVFSFSAAGGFEDAEMTRAQYVRQERRVFLGRPDGRLEISAEGHFQYQLSERNNFASVEVHNENRQRTALLGELQASALKRMLANGYISLVEFNELKQLDGYKQNQILVSRIYSELSLAEADALFGRDKIPWERVFSADSAESNSDDSARSEFRLSQLRDSFEKTGEKLKILRSSVVVFLGQTWDPSSEKFVPVALPVEKNAEFADLAKFDRNQFPLLAQIGRAVSEGDPLKGVFHHALQAVIPYFEYQAARAGIGTDRFLVLNTVDDDPHVRVYSSSLNLRVLNAELKGRLSAGDPSLASQVIAATPHASQLRSDGKRKHLMVGTVGLGQAKIAGSEFSWMQNRLRTGLMERNVEDALSLQVHRNFYRNILSMLDVRIDPSREKNPQSLLVMNLDHALVASMAWAELKKLGQWRPGSLEEILNHLMSASIPSGFVGPKNPKLLIPLDLIQKHESAILVQKIDADQLRQHGEIYLAAVALSVWKQWQDHAMSLPESVPELTFDIPNGWLDFQPEVSASGPPKQVKQSTKIRTINRDQALKRMPRIFFLTDDAVVAQGFKELGGTPGSAVQAEVLAEQMKSELEANLEKVVNQALADVEREASLGGFRSQEEIQARLDELVQRAMKGFSSNPSTNPLNTILSKMQLSPAYAMEFSASALSNLRERFPTLWSHPPASRRGQQICEESLWSVFP